MIAELKKVIKVLLPIILSSSKASILFSVIVNFINSLLLMGQTIALQLFFDSFVNFEKAQVLQKFLLLALVMILGQVVNGLLNIVIEDNSYKITRNVFLELQRRISYKEPLYFEDKQNLNKIEKAKEAAYTGVYLFNIVCLIIADYIPYFIMMAIYLGQQNALLTIIIPLVFLPMLISQIMRKKYFEQAAEKRAGLKRRYEHYSDCLNSLHYAKETRALRARGFFLQKLLHFLKMYDTEQLKAVQKSNRHELKMKLITLLGYVLIVILLIWCVMQESISIGAFGAVFTSLNTLFNMMETFICNQLGAVAECLANVSAYVDIVSEEEKHGLYEIRNFDIELRDVSFQYPDADKETLHNINFSLKHGEKIAVVGENGAGKSTFVKMLGALYTPTSGNMFISQKDVSDVDKKSLHKKTAIVSQQFNKYAMTVRENISFGEAVSGDKIDGVLEKVGLLSKMRKLEAGMNTVLTREFGKVDLSGGQWQRLAVARAYYKDSEMIILDEPTSAIDPKSEKEMYDMFRELSENKTTIIVTHRLAMTRFVDRIVVLHEGKIEEIGTHEELMKRNGRYAYMYRVQKESYK